MKSKLFPIFFLLLACCSISVGATKNKSPQTKPASVLDSKTYCTYFYGTGNATTVYIANVCVKPMKVDIEWVGNQPSRIVSYRVNQGPHSTNINVMRDIQRRDLKGTIIKEEVASLGLSASADVRVETKDLGNGAVAIMLGNTNAFPIYTEWEIPLTKGGNVLITFQGGVVLRSGQRLRVGGYHPGDGESYKVEKLAAEKEQY